MVDVVEVLVVVVLRITSYNVCYTKLLRLVPRSCMRRVAHMAKKAAGESNGAYAAAEFPNLDEREHKIGTGAEVKLDVILDVPVTISLEIGRTKINIRNLLQLNQAS